MLDKEAFCLTAQAIYDDLLLSLAGQGSLRRHFVQPTVTAHKIFLICRFPSAINTSHYHDDLKVVSEDEMGFLQSALAGTQSVSVVLFQVQKHFQKNVLELYQDADKLSYVCLVNECFPNATSVDLVTAVCSSLRRHLSRVHCVSKYQDFIYSPDGNKKKITKSTYFVILHSSFTAGGIEVISPCIEYTETWLCNSAVLTPKVHEEIKSIPEIFRFRLHTNAVPVQTTLGVTDRSCISFCISSTKADYSSSSLEQIYQFLRNETDDLDKRELQRVIPLIWVGSQHAVPSFFLHQFVTLVDGRRYSNQPQSFAMSKIQEILLSMDIYYHFQRRSILVLYAAGATLEAFRQAIFHADIILPFGREEGCFQCKFEPGPIQDSWHVELQTAGSTNYEAYQTEDDGTLTTKDGGVQTNLSTYLSHAFDAVGIRSAIVHVQGKSQQKVVTFLACSSIIPQIPGVIKDHQGNDRLLYYKQPEVFADTTFSNIHLKESRIDHHVISQTKGLNQGAKLSAFFPIRRNDLSRKRFNRVKQSNLHINQKDVLCTILDEAVPICLVNHDLTIQDAITLLDLLLHRKPILDHHSTFFDCSLNKPAVEERKGISEGDTIVLPAQTGIVHCHLQSNQFLTVFQPRFEEGAVYRCTSNGLHLSVCECTALILFLTGKINVFDLFKTAPKGRIVATWPTDSEVSVAKQSSHSSPLYERQKRNPVVPTKLSSPAQLSRTGASEFYTPSQHSPSVAQDTSHRHPEGSADTKVPKDASKHLSPPNPLGAETPSTVMINKRIQDTLDALVRKVPIPKLPSAGDVNHERMKLEDPNSNLQEQPDVTRGKRNLQATLLRNQEHGDQQVINPAINPVSPKQHEFHRVASAVSVPPIDQDPNGDCHMQDDYKVQKYFEQETPLIEQLPSTDAEDPAELSVVIPSPLTAIDASSTLEESQELKIIDELSKQLADYSSAPSQLPAGITNIQDSQDSQEVDARLDANLIQEIHMPDVESAAAPVAQFPVQNSQGTENSAVDLIEESSLASGTALTMTGNATRSNGKAPSGLPDQVVPSTSLSFEEQRQLTHMHALKQTVSLDASLTSMAFDEQDYKQAAVIYANLNATACFFATALKILSKSDWSTHVEFEDHIVHQAMKAVAQGWTTAVNLRNHTFGPFHLALAMCTLPKQVHGEVQRTFDSLAVSLPAPFLQKICSLVTFDCGVCGVSSSHFASTFFVLQPLPQNALGHDYFNSAAPWTDKLLPSDTASGQQYCNECSSSSDFLVNTCAASRLVWLQYLRESHPPANTYMNFLGKDSLFSGGCSWQCVALIIHQGHDPLNGEQQPAEHFYVLEMKDRKANSCVTTMLWDYITLMTPKSRMETAFVASFFVPQMSPPSGLGNVPTLSRKPKILLLGDQGSVKSSRPAEQGRIF